MTTFKKNQVLLLLGAGASVDAGIPHAQKMVEEIGHLVASERNWKRFQELFNYLRSACYYADGIRGLFGTKVVFNIERLVNTLEELNKKETHPLYPFVGAWNPKLVDVAGTGFENARDFRAAIVKHLRDRWLAVGDYESQAGYFKGLLRFQQEYEFPLRVFSLNYDLCVERVCGPDKVQRGFEARRWDWRLFDDTVEDEKKPLLLYKLHGSTDWTHTDGNLTYFDDPSGIQADNVAIIFGTSYKLQYVDPFLFFAYELRRWTLDQDAKLIVTVGYGFGDDHINGILGQALRKDSARRLLSVGPCSEEAERRQEVRAALGLSSPDQVLLDVRTAQEFLSSGLTLATLSGFFPEESEIVPEIPSNGGETAS